MTLRGSRVMSTEARSSNGSARALESVCARSLADTAPASITDATKLPRFSFELLTRSVASFAFSLPAWTSTRATPERVDCGMSANVSTWGARVSRNVGPCRLELSITVYVAVFA